MSFVAISHKNDQQLLNQLIADSVLVDPKCAKGRLLKAAATLFKSNGFERTTVRELAKTIGIQSGSLFHHYPNKQEILKQVMRQGILLTTHRVKHALAINDSVEAKLQALILCEFQAILLDTGAEMSVLVYEWRALSEDNQVHMLALRKIYEDLWLDLLTQAQQQNIIDIDPNILRRLLTGAISWSINWYKASGDVTLEQLAKMTLRLALSSNKAV